MRTSTKAALAALFGASTLALVYACSSTDKETIYVDGGSQVVYADGGTSVETVYVDGGKQIVYVLPDAGPLGDAGPNACADAAAPGEPLGPGMYGCGGAVQYAQRGTLCKAGCYVCSAARYAKAKHPATKATHNYWFNDSLNAAGTGTNSCSGVVTGGKPCTAALPTPMRVCGASTDLEGNVCNWTGCGLDTNAPNAYFGGCSGNNTAGTLCCPNASPSASGCASGNNTESFSSGMVGCKGTTTWPARAALCAANYHACSASEWVANRGGATPTHNYWTNDDLRYGGSGSGACNVSLSVGTVCAGAGITSPMHLCQSGTDPEGNACNVTGCGLETTANEGLGGCDPTSGAISPDAGADAGTDAGASYLTAGTLCCCP